jgi:hypothetical protein
MRNVFGGFVVMGLLLSGVVFADQAAEEKRCEELKAAAHKSWTQAHADERKIQGKLEELEKLMLDKQASIATARRDTAAAYFHCKQATADDSKAHALWSRAVTEEHKGRLELRRAQSDFNYANAEIKSANADKASIADFQKSVAAETDPKIKAEKEKTLKDMETEYNQNGQAAEALAKAAQVRIGQGEAAIKAAAALKAEAKKLDPKIEKEMAE